MTAKRKIRLALGVVGIFLLFEAFIVLLITKGFREDTIDFMGLTVSTWWLTLLIPIEGAILISVGILVVHFFIWCFKEED